MARPVNYLFCKYELEIENEVLGSAAEFNLISENQGGEYTYGREKEGVQLNVLCTDPTRHEVNSTTAHSFEIGFKPGIRCPSSYKVGHQSGLSTGGSGSLV